MKKKSLIIFLLFFVEIIPLFSNTDSIFKIFDSTNIKDKCKLIDSLISYDPSEALILAHKVKIEAEQRCDNEQIAYIYEQISSIYIENSEYSKALTFLEKAKNLYNNLLNKNPFNINLKKSKARCINNIGAIYFKIGKFKEAHKYINMRINMSLNNKDSVKIAFLYTNLAVVHNKLGNLDSSLYYNRKSLKILDANKENLDKNSKNSYLLLLNNYGTLCDRVNFKDSALYFYNKAEKLCKKYLKKDKKHLVLNKMLLSIYYNKALFYQKTLKNKKQYFEYMSLAEDIVNKYGFIEIAEKVYSSLNSSYKESNDFKNAYIYLNKYLICHDSIKAKQNIKQISKLEMQIKFDKWKASNRIQRNKEKSKYIISIILLISIIIIVALLFLWQRMKSKSDRLKKDSLLLEHKILKNQGKIKEKELEFQKNELKNFALHISLRDKYFNKLKLNLKKLKKNSVSDKDLKVINESLNIVYHSFEESSNREKIFLQVQKLSDTFYYKLKEKFPDLKKKDLNLAAMIRLELSSKEIGHILNISEKSVNNYKYRLKCKFNLSSKENFKNFIENI
ncbi:MAG: hypothetical protein IMY72_04930 [Bacteroidetes bacterium]|nr:hypothetical protein [Bacteroidota bacterium]